MTRIAAHARRLLNGRWRVFWSSDPPRPVRERGSARIAEFGSLGRAKTWWQRNFPEHAALEEAPACAACGKYFELREGPIVFRERLYHEKHLPEEALKQRPGSRQRRTELDPGLRRPFVD